ncbi:MAG: hypothetical protein ACI959_001478, partial [Limisphaerales bacterium]
MYHSKSIMVRLLFFAFVIVFSGCVLSENKSAEIKEITLSRVDTLGVISHDGILDRMVEVYLPANYSTSKKYPVLYMHDGQSLFRERPNSGWGGDEWGVDEFLDTLGLDVIVVGVYNTTER